MAKLAKRTAAARKAVEGKSNLAVDEAVRLIKANATAKFDETLEIAMNLGVDPRHADQMVRGVVSLPNGTGKTVRVAVFARGAKAEEAEKAGADIVGAEDLMETIQGGFAQGPHASDPSGDGFGPGTADEPRAGLANVVERGNLQLLCQLIEELMM